MSKKIIISCAITGAIHTPTMSNYLPITPQAIAAEAIEAAQAGAAIIHLHARNPKTGKPDQSPEAFSKFLPTIHKDCDAILNITTGGSPFMKVEERVLPALTFKPELASLNMGSMNFGLYPLLKKYKSFKHNWEREHLEASKDLVFKNTFKDIEYVLNSCSGNGTRFEFECYDTSHLYNLLHFVNRDLIKPPFFIQTVFGILGGIGTNQDDVIHMKKTADRLFLSNYNWSVLGAGASQMRIGHQAVSEGGNVRVGLEDSLWEEKGRLARSNATQVRKIRTLIENLGLEIASPNEARRILNLKGKNETNFY